MLTLLLGGAGSGKSTLAVRWGKSWGGPVTIVATAEPRDEEMRARIERHRAERPGDWTVVEEPLALERALTDIGSDDFVIVDCLTLWVSNLLEGDSTDDDIESAARAVALLAAARSGPTVVVSNEVGSGIVPANPLARRFRDVLGRVNAISAEAAHPCYLVVAGRVVSLSEPGGVDG